MDIKYATYREGVRKRGSKRPNGKPRPKKMSKERVYELVHKLILARKAEVEKDGLYWSLFHITAEGLATELQVEIDKVVWALHQLNLRGLVQQRTRAFAHDTTRNHMFPGTSTGWKANQYQIIVDMPHAWAKLYLKPTAYPEGTFPVWDEQESLKRGRFSKRLGCRMEVK